MVIRARDVSLSLWLPRSVITWKRPRCRLALVCTAVVCPESSLNHLASCGSMLERPILVVQEALMVSMPSRP